TEWLRSDEGNRHIDFAADTDAKVIVVHCAFVVAGNCRTIRRTAHINPKCRRETRRSAASDTGCRVCEINLAAVCKDSFGCKGYVIRAFEVRNSARQPELFSQFCRGDFKFRYLSIYECAPWYPEGLKRRKDCFRRIGV